MYTNYAMPWQYGWLRLGSASRPNMGNLTWWPPPVSIVFRVAWWFVVLSFVAKAGY